MLLSVVIPYFNSNAWIGKMLDSLLDQGIDNEEYEIIVIDDESTEEPVVLKEYVAKYPNIRYYKQQKQGQAEARNYGLSLSRGEWLYFCDSDDYLQPQVLSGIIDAAEKHNLELIFGTIHPVSPSFVPTNPKRNFESLSEIKTGIDYFAEPNEFFSFGLWSFLIRRSVLIEHNLRFEKLHVAEDCLFYVDMMPCIPRTAHIDVDLYYYVQHESSVMHRKKREDSSNYMADMYQFLLRLSDELKNTVGQPAYHTMMSNLLGVYSYALLHNVFRYCPVSETVDYISRLENLDAYPIRTRLNSPLHRAILKLVNTKPLWLLFCRLYHLLPIRLRLRF